jgi:hypothetical protein
MCVCVWSLTHVMSHCTAIAGDKGVGDDNENMPAAQIALDDDSDDDWLK